jgi:hypothetical protein
MWIMILAVLGSVLLLRRARRKVAGDASDRRRAVESARAANQVLETWDDEGGARA